MRFLISPGYTNSGPDHWQTHLENTYKFVDRIEHSNWDFVDRKTWLQEFEEAISLIEDDLVLIGHSCGTNVIAQWAESKSEHLKKVKAAILVAPADVDNQNLPQEIGSQRPMPYTKLPFPTLVIGSDNDPFTSLETLGSLAKAWGAELAVIPKAGHIASDDGYGKWNDIAEYIEEFAKTKLLRK